MEELRAHLDFLTETEAKEIVETAKSKAEQLVSEARANAGKIKEREGAEIERKSRDVEVKELEIAGLDAKRKIMNLKFKLIESVFDAAFEKLKKMASDQAPSYINSLEKFVVEACSLIDASEFELILSLRDIEFVEKRLKKIEAKVSAIKNVQVKMTLSDEPLRSIGGAVVRSKDRKQIFNDTLEARLAKARQEKLQEISSTLFEGAQP